MCSSSHYSQSVSLGKGPLHHPTHPKTVANSDHRAPPVSVDQVVSDFDNVTFHVSTPETKSKILISISVKCYKELLQYSAHEVLEREYGPYIVAPEAGYDFSVLVDLDNLPAEPGGSFISWKMDLQPAESKLQKHEKNSYAGCHY